MYLGVLCLIACDGNHPEGSFVDLGLPSGTKWKKVNEYNSQDSNGFYTYEEAVNAFGESLPTKEQFEELIDKCTWTWTDGGIKVEGGNGNFIILPAAGSRSYSGDVCEVGEGGFYWSSTPDNYGSVWMLDFSSTDQFVRTNGRDEGNSVRLVKKSSNMNEVVIQEAQLIGIWQMTSMIQNGIQMDITPISDAITWEFTEDHILIEKWGGSAGPSNEQTWDLDKNKLLIGWATPEQEYIITSFKINTLVIQWNIYDEYKGNSTTIMTFKKL